MAHKSLNGHKSTISSINELNSCQYVQIEELDPPWFKTNVTQPWVGQGLITINVGFTNQSNRLSSWGASSVGF